MTAAPAVEVFAPAKINLALHVTGTRSDGYHLLDTLVAFADIGDTVTLRAAGPTDITVTGPEADRVLATRDNIMWHAAAKFWTPDTPLSLALDKQLPIASGIGGGSADAAACFRGLLFLRGLVENREPRDIGPEDLAKLLQIGADVPMCVLSEPARVRGIGEQVEPLAAFPPLWVVLVNPRRHVSTPEIFRSLDRKANAPMTALPDDLQDASGLIDWLHDQRNDLEPVVTGHLLVVSEVLSALRAAPGCQLARMSGSGATCFGLFLHAADARSAASEIEAAHADWWVRHGSLDGGRHVAPRDVTGSS